MNSESYFYIIKLLGDSTNTIINGDYNIESISLASGNFSSDLDAVGAVKNATDFITSHELLKNAPVINNIVDFNPEFLPNAIQEETFDDPIIITKKFDSFGDFILMRQTIQSEAYTIISRTGLDPKDYIKRKQQLITSDETLH